MNRTSSEADFSPDPSEDHAPRGGLEHGGDHHFHPFADIPLSILHDKHGAVVEASLTILRGRFADDEKTEGYRKDGPVSVAKFELGEGDEPELREARALRQREASDVIARLLAHIG